MRLSSKYLLIAACAAVTFSVVGCQGGSPGGAAGYTPASSASLPAPAGILPDKKHKGDIDSSCGKRIKIVLLGFVDCKFNAPDYGGNFKVYNHTQGLIGITPETGTKDTTFTVTGLLIGKGSFMVRDHRGQMLKIKVSVSLL
jgi:hypothetical protein